MASGGAVPIAVMLILIGTMSLDVTGARAGVRGELAVLLDRAAVYVQQYRETFLHVMADEHYLQEVERQIREGPEPFFTRWQPFERRELTSELVLVRLAGDIQWTGVRDVRSVDGRAIPQRFRVAQLLASDGIDRPGLIRQLLQESARYNLGPINRDFNDPLLPLLFISREHQHRFQFESRGVVDANGVRLARIEFEETVHPTLIQRSGASVPSRGELWIDPASGALVRSDHRLGERQHHPHAHVVITYRPDTRLGVRVPDTMREVYTHSGGYRVTCTATYTNFRRFEVESRVLEPRS